MNSILCGLPRVNQAETKEENFDEYIFCSRCCVNVYEYCSIHGPLLVIPDDEVPKQCNLPLRIPKAAFTIPSKFLHLASSAISGPRNSIHCCMDGQGRPGKYHDLAEDRRKVEVLRFCVSSDSGVGVFATWPLPAGVRFGPYRGRITRGIGSQYCWQIHSRVGPTYAVDAADAGHSNWMRYVNCSRNWHQQNLLAFQYRGQIYYRTIKTIPRFGELLVFYGSEFACSLNIDLTIYNSHKPRYDDADKSKAATDDTRAKCQKTVQFTENKPEIFDKFGYDHLQGDYFNRTVVGETVNETNVTYCQNADEKQLNTDETQNPEIAMSFTNNLAPSHLNQCSKCGKNFAKRKYLNAHEVNVHLKTKLRCTKCPFTTSSKFLLYRHTSYHNKENLYKCDLCDHSTYKRKFLNRHLKTVHKIVVNPLQCNHYKTIDTTKYMHHVTKHKDLKCLPCRFCQFVTHKEGLLKRHVLRMHKNVSI